MEVALEQSGVWTSGSVPDKLPSGSKEVNHTNKVGNQVFSNIKAESQGELIFELIDSFFG
jgi:hypothetical protein